ncbi:MAG: amidase [Bacteroidetes bacterium]|nr:amidase [Bacteroidota bacterium]
MDRRNFLNKGSIGVAALGIAACTRIVSRKDDSPLEPYVPVPFDLDEITIEQLQQRMTSGELSSRKITQMYLDRIQEIDKAGPKLNAIIELNPDALANADAMDKERKNGKIRGPLHGIPVLIKDNISTADKMMTTAGSLALVGSKITKDAFIIERLREAGAVLLGKTNLSEWANFRSTHSASGWSSRGGQTRNPYVLDRSPSGSSSGSAVAVAANLCAVAIGTETDGSVIAPSSYCGIVGMKPTVGLLSRSGIIPISSTQDTAGPMARTVRDLAILLGALTGPDLQDEATKAGIGKAQEDYTKFLDASSLKGKRIGAEKSFFSGNSRVVDLYSKALEELRKQGAIIIEIEMMKLMNDFADAELLILEYEFKNGVNAYLKQAGGNIKSLAEVISFNKQNETKTMPYFKQEILESCEAKGDLTSAEYQTALAKTLTSREIIDGVLRKYQLDAIAGTSIGPPCCIDLVNGDYDTGFYFCTPAAMAGYPHITVPMGKVHSLPVGFSFISGAWKEADLLSIAYAYEQGSRKREKPTFLYTSIPQQPGN